jgi:hypothetical protein
VRVEDVVRYVGELLKPAAKAKGKAKVRVAA